MYFASRLGSHYFIARHMTSWHIWEWIQFVYFLEPWWKWVVIWLAILMTLNMGLYGAMICDPIIFSSPFCLWLPVLIRFRVFISFLLLTFLLLLLLLCLSKYQESLYLYLATRLDMPYLVHFLGASWNVDWQSSK